MSEMTNFNYPEAIGALNAKQRICFYELFAHFLTVSMRGILFFEGVPDPERVERAKWINEIAHRITNKVYIMRKEPEVKWTDEEIWQIIQMNTAKHPATEADVNIAIEMSYGYVLDNESGSV